MSSRSSGVRVADGLTKVRAWSAGIAACAGCDWMASSQVPWFRMQACIQRWMRERLGSSGTRLEPRPTVRLERCLASVPIGRDLFQLLRLGGFSFAIPFGLQRFGMHDFEARNIGIPFEQRRDAAHALEGVAIEIPNHIDDV